jgi:hypothetical protein
MNCIFLPILLTLQHVRPSTSASVAARWQWLRKQLTLIEMYMLCGWFLPFQFCHLLFISLPLHEMERARVEKMKEIAHHHHNVQTQTISR